MSSKINQWYDIFISLFITLLFFFSQILKIDPNFGGDSNRLYLFYFDDYKNISHNILNFYNPDNSLNLFSNQRFFIDVNIFLNKFIPNIILYHLNNMLPLLLCVYGLIKIINFYFQDIDLKKKYLITVCLTIFFLSNKYTSLNIVNAGVWSHSYFLLPFLTYLFMDFCRHKNISTLIIYCFAILYFQFFDIGNIGFIFSYLLLLFFFYFIFNDFFQKNIKIIILFIFLTVFLNLNYIFNIFIGLLEASALGNLDQQFHVSGSDNFRRASNYLSSYIHTVNYGNLLLRLPDLKLDIISNNFVFLNNLINFILNYFFLLVIFMIVIYYIIQNNIYQKYLSQKILKLVLLFILFSFLSSPNINDFLFNNFLQIFHLPFSSSFRSVNIKFFLNINIIYIILLVFVFYILIKSKKFKILNLLISLIFISNIIFVISINLEDKKNNNYSNIVGYGQFSKKFESQIKILCKNSNYNILSYPISNQYFFYKYNKDYNYNSYSPLPYFCDRLHFYNLTNTQLTNKFIVAIYNEDEEAIYKLINKNNIGIFLIYKNIDKNDLQNFPPPFNSYIGNYKRQYLINYLIKNDYKLEYEDENFFYFKVGKKIKIFQEQEKDNNIRRINRYAYFIENEQNSFGFFNSNKNIEFSELNFWTTTDNIFLTKIISSYSKNQLLIKDLKYQKIIYYFPFFLSELIYLSIIASVLSVYFYVILKKNIFRFFN